MPSSLRKALVGCAAVIAFAASGGAFAGCAPEGTTPACNDNVTADGMQSGVENPCNAFGQCMIGGKVRPAADCCADEDGPFTGNKLTFCLYGFGAVDLGGSTGGAGGSGGAGGG